MAVTKVLTLMHQPWLVYAPLDGTSTKVIEVLLAAYLQTEAEEQSITASCLLFTCF